MESLLLITRLCLGNLTAFYEGITFMFAPLFWSQSLEGPSFEDGWEAQPVYPIGSLGLCASAFFSLVPSLIMSCSSTDSQTVVSGPFFGSLKICYSDLIPDSSHPTLPPDFASVSSSKSLKILLLSGFRSLTVMCLGLGLLSFILPNTTCPFQCDTRVFLAFWETVQHLWNSLLFSVWNMYKDIEAHLCHFLCTFIHIPLYIRAFAYSEMHKGQHCYNPCSVWHSLLTAENLHLLPLCTQCI